MVENKKNHMESQDNLTLDFIPIWINKQNHTIWETSFGNWKVLNGNFQNRQGFCKLRICNAALYQGWIRPWEKYGKLLATTHVIASGDLGMIIPFEQKPPRLAMYFRVPGKKKVKTWIWDDLDFWTGVLWTCWMNCSWYSISNLNK